MQAMDGITLAESRAKVLGNKGLGKAIVTIAVIFGVIGILFGLLTMVASYSARNAGAAVAVGIGIIVGTLIQAVFIAAAGAVVQHLRSIAISNVQACDINAQAVRLLAEAVGYQQGG